MKSWWSAIAATMLLASGCALQREPAPIASAAEAVRTPAELFGDLFVEVQKRRLFPDSKTFADAVPREPPAAIMAAYARADTRSDEALRRFVLAHFDVPESAAEPDTAPWAEKRGLLGHIAELWPHLTRPPLDPPAGSSALALPAPYVVPGGRFREMYYWDSYFTMLGLREDGQDALIESMLADFVSLVERYGHVPNGTRSYYVSRSQPPFLYLMMGLSRSNDPAQLSRRLAALRREHDYWSAPGREVRMPDGSRLTRYVSSVARPREESWREDRALRDRTGRAADDLYPDIRAAAESGWDFSSRWFADGRTLATIDTSNVVPVDLNALLYGLERTIEAACGRANDAPCAERFREIAEARRAAIERWLWSDAEARYGDWDVKRGTLRPGLTAATAYPLFTGVASPGHAEAAAKTIAAKLLAPGGLRTTLVRTGEQWDAPNGWAPLQWIAVAGLRRYGQQALAQEIAHRFLATVTHEYRLSGKLVEKYDVEEVRPGGGGEYPLQDGFGWTNGVVRALIADFGEPARPQ